MERVRLNYSINIANKVGVQDVIYGKMYLHTSNINSENELMDKVTEAMENIMVELDYFYSHEDLDDGESRWIEPTMKTIH